MSSGMGVRGTVSRCFGFFSDYKACQKSYAQELAKEDPKHEGCFKYREDYFECLHGRKETARVQRVLEEQRKQLAEA